MFIFARFYARVGAEPGLEEALRDVAGPTREEAGCMSFHAFRSIRDPRLFYVHSRFRDAAAFATHAALAHTVRFLERVDPLLDAPREVTRANLIV